MCHSLLFVVNTLDLYVSLGTIKASHVVVLNKDMKLLLNENSCKQHDPHTEIEFDFVKHHTHFNIYVSQQSQIQIED